MVGCPCTGGVLGAGAGGEVVAPGGGRAAEGEGWAGVGASAGDGAGVQAEFGGVVVGEERGGDGGGGGGAGEGGGGMSRAWVVPRVGWYVGAVGVVSAASVMVAVPPTWRVSVVVASNRSRFRPGPGTPGVAV